MEVYTILKALKASSLVLRDLRFVFIFYFYGVEADRSARLDHRLSSPGRQFNAKAYSWHQSVTPILFSSWNLRFYIALQVILYNFVLSVSTILTS